MGYTSSIWPYGIVTHIATGPHDAHRSPMPLQKSYEELQQEYPHIFHLLQTSFTCIVIGHFVNDTFVYQAPATPAQLHGFIQPATNEAYHAIFSQETYMPLLFQAPQLDATIDELILAIMRHLAHHRMLSAERISRIVETFSMLINNDYRRLKLLLERIEQLRHAYIS